MLFTRGGVEDTKLKPKAKAKAIDTKKNPRPRPRTALPRTDPHEAKDRNARGRRQVPRTQAEGVLQKKDFKIFFRRSSQKKSASTKFFRQSPKKTVFKKIFKTIYKILTIQKIVLSSNGEQSNFRSLRF